MPRFETAPNEPILYPKSRRDDTFSLISQLSVVPAGLNSYVIDNRMLKHTVKKVSSLRDLNNLIKWKTASNRKKYPEIVVF
jgi:hypothetical protein